MFNLKEIIFQVSCVNDLYNSITFHSDTNKVDQRLGHDTNSRETSSSSDDSNRRSLTQYIVIVSSLFIGIILVGNLISVIRRNRNSTSDETNLSSNIPKIDTAPDESEILMSVVSKWKNIEKENNQSATPPALLERKHTKNDSNSLQIPENSRIRSSLKIQLHKILETSKQEIDIANIHIGDQIGSGNFGKVFKGTIQDDSQSKTVAVKTISDENVNETELENIICEIKIMSSVDPHLNLVGMLASCSSEFQAQGKLWLLLEFCKYGDLKMFLQENRCRLSLANPNDELNNRCLIKWAHDIANGMEYLSSKEIMHGDLAARNIMMDENPLKGECPVAKIADFGLSKKFNDSLIYEKESRLFVPWRWMALEYLTESYFTLKSDVWSFGVLFWEILSLGKVPYGQQSYDEVLEGLKNGYRLHFPDNLEYINIWSPTALFSMLSEKCFKENPEDRSSFSEVVEIIRKELSEDEIFKYRTMNDAYIHQI